MQTALYLLKSGGKNKLLEWGNMLMNTYKTDALETLKEEKCMFEMMCFITIDGRDYVFGMMLEEYINEDILPANKDKELNKMHRDVLRNAIEKPLKEDIEVMYELRREL